MAASTASLHPPFIEDPPPPPITIEGSYILFNDKVHANCCPGKIELHSTILGNLIKLYEAEHEGEYSCTCVCDFPVKATLGPFEPGQYTLEIYEQFWGFDGTLLSEKLKDANDITIGPG